MARPDGSLVASDIRTKEGARVRSTFAGQQIAHEITLPDGELVFVERAGPIQSVAVRSPRNVLVASKWAPGGPKIARRPRRAFQEKPDFFPDIDHPGNSDDLQGQFDLDDAVLPTNPLPSPDASGLGAAALGLLLLGDLFAAKPEAMGATRRGPPIVIYKAVPSVGNAVAVRVDVLEEERARQSCQLFPDVQAVVAEATIALAQQRSAMNPKNYGIAFHLAVKRAFEALADSNPERYSNVQLETSLTTEGESARYAQGDSIRMDILELIPNIDRPTLICDYEVKTGSARFRVEQRNKYATGLHMRYPDAAIFLIQVNSDQFGRTGPR